MKRWKKQDHARCPLCDHPDEDVHHMLTCPCTEAQSAWEIELDILSIHLSEIAPLLSVYTPGEITLNKRFQYLFRMLCGVLIGVLLTNIRLGGKTF